MKLIVFLAGCAFLAQAYADDCPCLFGPGIDGPCGEDSISSEELPLLVRPCPVPKPKVIPVPEIKLPEISLPPIKLPPILPTLFPLKPIGGPCFCKKTIVKPAIVPKPPCYDTAALKIEQSQIQHQINAAAAAAASASCSGAVHINPAHIAPADAVSLSIAHAMAQKAKNYVNEDKLFYGFRKLPKELPRPVRKEVRKNLIPEGNLYDLNGQIVELKTSKVNSCSGSRTLAEEAEEELVDLAEEEMEEQAEAEAAAIAKQVTLGELGYDIAKIKPAPFVPVPSLVEAAVGAIEGLLEHGGSNNKRCQDGYVAGEVIQQNVPKRRTIVKPPQPLPSCIDSIEEGIDHVDYLLPSVTSYSSKASHRHSVKESSSHARYTQQSGCGRF